VGNDTGAPVSGRVVGGEVIGSLVGAGVIGATKGCRVGIADGILIFVGAGDTGACIGLIDGMAVCGAGVGPGVGRRVVGGVGLLSTLGLLVMKDI
jgi:hypothetical protein